MLFRIEGEAIGSAHIVRGPPIRAHLDADETGDASDETILLRIEDVDRGIRAVGDVIPVRGGIDIADIEIVEFVARYVDRCDPSDAGGKRAGADHSDGGRCEKNRSRYGFEHDWPPGAERRSSKYRGYPEGGLPARRRQTSSAR